MQWDILNQIFFCDIILALNAGFNMILCALHSQSNYEASSFSDYLASCLTHLEDI